MVFRFSAEAIESDEKIIQAVTISTFLSLKNTHKNPFVMCEKEVLYSSVCVFSKVSILLFIPLIGNAIRAFLVKLA